MIWDEFSPYLAAYLWPIQHQPGAEIELYACSETNGASELAGSKTLSQAGFLVAAAFAEDDGMFLSIQEMVRVHNMRTDRSVVGMSNEIKAFLDTPQTRYRACQALEDVQWFTGLQVINCRAVQVPHG